MKPMTLAEFESAYSALGENPKTKEIDALNKRLLKQNVDVSFLAPIVRETGKYFRTYVQISILQAKSKEEKMRFVEEHFDLLHDWWHVDSIVSFLGNSLDFDYALTKAREYVQSELPYVRRLGYVLFIPRLVRDPEQIEPLFALLKNDDAYHVVMGEAWLISYLAMCDADRTYAYLRDCSLTYDIVGRAIQKICDSYVVPTETKVRFKTLRESRKAYRVQEAK